MSQIIWMAPKHKNLTPSTCLPVPTVPTSPPSASAWPRVQCFPLLSWFQFQRSYVIKTKKLDCFTIYQKTLLIMKRSNFLLSKLVNWMTPCKFVSSFGTLFFESFHFFGTVLEFWFVFGFDSSERENICWSKWTYIVIFSAIEWSVFHQVLWQRFELTSKDHCFDRWSSKLTLTPKGFH